LTLAAVAMLAPWGLSSAHAADAAAAFKVGYVDMARSLNEVEDGKTAKAKLKSEFDQKQQKLDKMQTDLKNKKDEFDKRAAMMNTDAKQAKQEELQREYMEVQKVYMQLQQELVESEGQITQDIGHKLRGIIEKIGDRDGYQAILNLGEGVLYSKRHQDMTNDVIREYNKQYGKK
jgi:outer membrane protein